MRDAAAEAAWQSYRRMRTQLASQINRDLSQATGLSEADFEILTALSAAEHRSLRSRELRCGLDWEKSRLSHQLRRMEERGLVSREACAEDSRSVVIRLTAVGKTTYSGARRCHEAAVERYFVSALDAEQLAALGEASAAILSKLDAAEPSGKTRIAGVEVEERDTLRGTCESAPSA